MIKRLFLTFAVLLLSLQSSGLSDEDQNMSVPISVRAELDKAFITIGDDATYTVTIRHAPDIQILSRIPVPGKNIFEIKKIDEFNREEDGLIAEGRRMILTTYRLGEFIIDPVRIEYRYKDSQDIESIETNRIFLTVQSIAEGSNETDIRGVKSVIEMTAEHKRLLIIIGVAVLLLLVGLWLLRLFKRDKDKVVIETPKLSPKQEALKSLSELFDSSLLREGKTKLYFLRMSEILRIFFQRQFNVIAVESTTYETMNLLKPMGLPSALMAKIEEVLNDADLAKFAKWKPEPAQIINLNKRSKEIVEEAAPFTEDTQSGI